MTIDINKFVHAQSPALAFLRHALFLLIGIATYLLVPYLWANVPEEIKHLLLLLIVMVALGMIERVFIYRDIEHWFNSLSQNIISSIESLLHELNHDHLWKECGLEMVFPNREHAKCDIMKSIEECKSRAYLLGVAFSDIISLKKVACILNHKLEVYNEFDAKFLLIDPLSSAAIERSFLESSREKVEKFIKAPRRTRNYAEPYVHTKLYTDVINSFETLIKYPMLDPAIRFYSQNPSCWMLILDDTIYFQPYTFGKGIELQQITHEDTCMGSQMPVFKYNAKISHHVTDILADHYNKVWISTDFDSIAMGARLLEHRKIIKHTVMQKRQHFHNVYSTLFNCSNDYKPVDRRKSPRRKCRSKIPISLESDSIDKKLQPVIENYSRKGLAVRLNDIPKIKINSIIKFEKTRSNDGTVNYVLEKVLGENQYTFRVKGIEPVHTIKQRGDKIILRLEAAEH